MNKTTVVGLLLAVFMLVGCCDKTWCIGFAADSLAVTTKPVKVASDSVKKDKESRVEDGGRRRITDFVPQGYKLMQKVSVDLNNDGNIDCVLIIKATNKNRFGRNEHGDMTDYNRRGIIVLLNRDGKYEIVSKNLSCFKSDEQYAVGLTTRLDVNVDKGMLDISFIHESNGQTSYYFRFQNNDFVLVKANYYHSCGSTTITDTVYDFLTGRGYIDTNINSDDGEKTEEYEREYFKLKKAPLQKLSEIRAFENLEFEEE